MAVDNNTPKFEDTEEVNSTTPKFEDTEDINSPLKKKADSEPLPIGVKESGGETPSTSSIKYDLSHLYVTPKDQQGIVNTPEQAQQDVLKQQEKRTWSDNFTGKQQDLAKNIDNNIVQVSRDWTQAKQMLDNNNITISNLQSQINDPSTPPEAKAQIESSLEGLHQKQGADIATTEKIKEAAIGLQKSKATMLKINDEANDLAYNAQSHLGQGAMAFVTQAYNNAIPNTIQGIGDLVQSAGELAAETTPSGALNEKVQEGIDNRIKKEPDEAKKQKLNELKSTLDNNSAAFTDYVGGLITDMGKSITAPTENLDLDKHKVADFTGGLVGSIASVALPTGALGLGEKGAKIAAAGVFGAQGAKQAWDEAEQAGITDKKDKAAFTVAMGAVNGAVTTIGLHKVIDGAFGNTLVKDVMKEAAEKIVNSGATGEGILDVVKQTFKDKSLDIAKHIGTNALKSSGEGFLFGTALGASDVAGKQIFNTTQEKPVFKDEEGKPVNIFSAEAGKNILESGAMMALGAGFAGTVLGGTGKQNRETAYYDKVVKLGADEHAYNTLNEKLDAQVKSGELNPDEAQAMKNNIDNIIETDKKIPATITDKSKRIEALNLITERNKLSQDNAQAQTEMSGLDAAMTEPHEKEIAKNNKRIDEINSDLTLIAKDSERTPIFGRKFKQQDINLNPKTNENSKEAETGEKTQVLNDVPPASIEDAASSEKGDVGEVNLTDTPATLNEPLNTETNDNKDQTRLQSGIGEGKEPIKAKSNESASTQKIVSSGVVQEPQKENELSGRVEQGEQGVETPQESETKKWVTKPIFNESEEIKELRKKHPDVSFSVNETNDGIELKTLFVEKDLREQGKAPALLKDLKAYADKVGKKITLTATDEFGGDIKKLNEFYPKNGFEKVGENKFEYNPEKKISGEKGEEQEKPKSIGLTKAKMEETIQEKKLTPLEKQAREGQEEIFDRVKKEYDNGDRNTEELVNELLRNPHKLIGEEQLAELQIHRITLENKLKVAENKVDKAIKDGSSEETINKLKDESDGIRLDIELLQKAVDPITTVWGRFGKMLSYLYKNDFSRANMERIFKNENNGGELTQEQKDFIDKVQKRNEELNQREEELNKRHAEFETNKVKEEGQQTVNDLVKKNKNRFKLTDEEKSERLRLKNKFAGRFNDVTSVANLLADKEFLKYGKLLAKEAVFDFTEFSKNAINELGEKVKPILKEWFNKSLDQPESNIQKLVDKAVKLTDKIGEEKKKGNKKEVEQLEKERALTQGQIGDLTKSLDQPEAKLAGMSELLKHYAKEGVNDFDKMVEKIQQHFPDVPKEKIEKEISGYGKKHLPSKDEIQKTIAELRAEGKLKLGLKDVLEKNKLPERSGIIRETPSDKILKLRDDLRKAILENSPNFEELSDEEKAKRFKSALDTYKSRNKKLIAEYEKKLANKEFDVKPRKLLELDEEAEKIKLERERIKQDFDVQREYAKREHEGTLTQIGRGLAQTEKFSIFASAHGIVKLVYAALFRFPAKPVKELINYALSKNAGITIGERNFLNTKKIYEKNSAVYTPDIKTAYNSVKDYYSTFFSKKSRQEAIKSFGKTSDFELKHREKDHTKSRTIFGKIADIPQQTHGFLKTFPKLAEYASSYNRALSNFEKQGLNTDSSNVKKMAELSAKNEALSDIFMQKNEAPSIISGAIDRGLKSKRQSIQTLAILTQQQLPVLKVASNFFRETIQSLPLGGILDALGTIHRAGDVSKMNKAEGGKLTRIMGGLKKTEGYRGVSNLTPEQAHQATRALTAQALGVVATGIGYALYKKDKDLLKSMKDNEYYWHGIFPMMVMNGMEIAEYANKEDSVAKGVSEGVGEELKKSIKGLPLSKFIIQMKPVLTGEKSGLTKFTETISNALTPAIIEQIAEHFDKDKNGNTVIRDPQSVLEVLKKNIPELRNEVTPKGGASYAKKQEKILNPKKETYEDIKDKREKTAQKKINSDIIKNWYRTRKR